MLNDLQPGTFNLTCDDEGFPLYPVSIVHHFVAAARMMYELNSQPTVQSTALDLATKISTEMNGVCPKVSS